MLYIRYAAARVRWGIATRRRKIQAWTRRRYQITNNRYQTANVTAGLSRQRDADMSVTDTAARVCRGSGDAPP